MRSSDASHASTARQSPVGDLLGEARARIVSHPITRGTLKGPLRRAASGALPSSSARVSVGAGTSSRSTGRFMTCEVGGDAGGVERANLFDVGEDVAELPREQLELLGGQLQPRELRDPLHILPCSTGHDKNEYR